MAKSEKRQTKKTATVPGGLNNNVLVVAPHGVPQDDENTDVIAKELGERLGVEYFFNNFVPRSKVNLNDTKDLKEPLRAHFLDKINYLKTDIVERHGSALVVLIHGIDDKNITETAGKNSHVLIGIGQSDPGDQRKHDRFTLDQALANHLVACLHKHGLVAALAPGGSGYCGWDKNNLNQLFRDKTRKKFYEPNVQSVQLEIRKKNFRETPEQAKKTAELLDKAFTEFLTTEPKQPEEPETVSMPKHSPVKKVRLDDIQLKKADDRKYIFRATSEDGEVKERLEVEIQELADSIKKAGQLHPLILIQNGHGKYRLLCGFRRFQALKRLKKEHAIATIYQESDLTEQQRIHISVAENARRRNLNPVEIGIFLQAARGNGKDKKTLSELGEEFGKMLGIGTSHGSVKKYLKLNEMREKGESPEIIDDVLKNQLAFGTAAEVLAFIGNVEDRNQLYKQIVKPLKPTRPELTEIKNLLRNMGNGFKATLTKKKVKKAIKQAQECPHKGQELITLLRLQTGHHLTKLEKKFEHEVDALRKTVFGQDATKDDFDVMPPPDMEKNELTVHFKVTDEEFDGTVGNIKKLLGTKNFRQLLDLVVNARFISCDKRGEQSFKALDNQETQRPRA